MSLRLRKRCFRSKTRDIHFTPPISVLTFIVRRQFRDQERELLSRIHPHTKLLGEIGVAVGVGEDAIHNLPRATQGRRKHLPPPSVKSLVPILPPSWRSSRRVQQRRLEYHSQHLLTKQRRPKPGGGQQNCLPSTHGLQRKKGGRGVGGAKSCCGVTPCLPMPPTQLATNW